MTKGLWKDFFMEIRKNRARFISIFCIVALGVAFFSGILASSPDMRYSGDDYYDAADLMDLKIVGTLGLTDEDVEAVRKLDGITTAVGSYAVDVVTGEGTSLKVLHVEAMLNELNTLDVQEGQLPQKEDECFLDIHFAEGNGYEVGDTITLDLLDSELLLRDQFIVAGIGSSPLYISFNRGNTNIGTGEINGFMYVTPQAFDREIYTEIYAALDEARDAMSYSGEYDAIIEQITDVVKGIEADRCQFRYDSVVTEAQGELDDAKKELDDGKAEAEEELEDADAELEAAACEIAEGRKQLRDGKKEIENGKMELEDGREELKDARKKLDDGKTELDDAEKKLSDGEAQLADAVAQAESGEQELADAKQQALDGQKQLDDAKAELEDGQRQIEEAQQQIDDGWEQLEAGRQELEEKRGLLESGKQELDENQAAILAASEEAQAGLTQIEENEAALAEQKSEMSGAMALREELEGSKAYVEGGLLEIQNALPLVQGGIAEIQAELPGLRAELENASAAGMDESAIAEIQGAVSAAEARLLELQGQESALLGQNEELLGQQAAIEAALGQIPSAEELEASMGQIEAGEELLAQKRAEAEGGLAALEAAQAEVDAGYLELEQNEALLEEGEAQLQASEEELISGQAELDAKAAEAEEGWKTIEESQAELDSGWEQIYENEGTLAEGWDTINSSYAELEDGRAEVEKGRKELEDGEKEYLDGQKELEDGEKEILENEQKIVDSEQELKDGEDEFADGLTEYEDARSDAEKEIADAEQKVLDAQAEIDDIKLPEWIVSNRDDLPEYADYGDNALRIANLGKVFPVIFFLVAALICLTTMTRMIEEQRTQIGTLKALGYSKTSIAVKYVLYAFTATLAGSGAGILIGEKVIPFVIITAYGIMYHNVSGTPSMPYEFKYAAMATGAALFCTVGATLFACWKTLMETPASLMRPPAPKDGKRILLERMGFIWKRMSFSWKSSMRNLFRYKKRLFMTIFGIAGSMGLMLVGFGIRDSIGDIVRIQYEDIFHYDGYAILEDDADDAEKEALCEWAEKSDRIDLYMEIVLNKMNLKKPGSALSCYLLVPSDLERYKECVTLQDRMTKEAYELDDQGVVICEKTASLLGVSVGDEITLESDNQFYPVKVSAITENYMSHYVYMTPKLYEEVFSEEPVYNDVCFRVAEAYRDQTDQVGQEILDHEGVLSISYVSSVAGTIERMLSTLGIVILVLIISAGLLAFVVLYNLNNINITERKRELATLKVLGFFDTEVSNYVFRENIFLTIIGILFGSVFGTWLTRYVIVTVEVDAVMFGRDISGMSYLYCAVLTAGFSLIVNGFMHFKLKKIDMVESLKSVE